MKKNKRVLGVLLTFILIIGALLVATPLIRATNAATIANGWSGYVKWSLTEDGVFYVFGNGTMKNYSTKTEMPWYAYADQIEEVIVEDGVTSVGNYAFYGMPQLKNVKLADTVTSIGDYAFKNCNVLERVGFPSGLTNLGESAFYACTSLRAVDIPSSLYTVKPYVFKNCTALEEVVLHEGNLMKLSDGAFYGCTNLREIKFPACLDIIDVYCFKGCSKLDTIMIPKGDLTQLREAVFYGTAISNIVIPEGITVIKPYAFKNCTKLIQVDFPVTLTNVDEAAFYACTSLTKVNFPEKVTAIGNYAFRKCTSLNSIQFSKSLISIGESSFYGCVSLAKLVIPDATKTIGAYAFKGCSGLKEVQLGQNLEALKESAFYGCTGLESISIPEQVTLVGDYCFSKNTGLNVVIFNGNAPVIGSGVFNQVVASVYYPADNSTWTTETKKNYGGQLTWKDLSDLVDPDTYQVTFVDYDGTTLKTETVKQNEDAVAPVNPSKDGAEFLGWTGNYSNVTKDETVRAVYSDEKNVILVHSVSGKADDSVTVLVEITGVVKACGFDFDMFFDSNLELVSYDNDLHLDVVFNADAYEHGVSLNFSSTTDKVKAREIVALTFQINKSASGALPIEVNMNSIKELDGNRIVDTNYVLVNGIVTIE